MTELRVLKAGNAVYSEQSEAMLLDWLESVRAGRIVSVAIVGVRPDGSVDYSCTDGGGFVTMVGGLEILKHRLLSRNDAAA